MRTLKSLKEETDIKNIIFNDQDAAIRIQIKESEKIVEEERKRRLKERPHSIEESIV